MGLQHDTEKRFSDSSEIGDVWRACGKESHTYQVAEHCYRSAHQRYGKNGARCIFSLIFTISEINSGKLNSDGVTGVCLPASGESPQNFAFRSGDLKYKAGANTASHKWWDFKSCRDQSPQGLIGWSEILLTHRKDDGYHTCGLLNRLMALRLESGSADQSAVVMVKRYSADKATHRRAGGNLAAINNL